MNFTDISLVAAIAIVYNIFVHHVASIASKDMQYDDKYNQTVVIVVVFGGLGILLSKIMEKENEKKKGKSEYNYIINGLYYGGILLMLTAIFVNWGSMVDEMQLFLIGAVLVGLVWYSYGKGKTVQEKKDVDGKINEKIIDELADEVPVVKGK